MLRQKRDDGPKRSTWERRIDLDILSLLLELYPRINSGGKFCWSVPNRQERNDHDNLPDVQTRSVIPGRPVPGGHPRTSKSGRPIPVIRSRAAILGRPGQGGQSRSTRPGQPSWAASPEWPSQSTKPDQSFPSGMSWMAIPGLPSLVGHSQEAIPGLLSLVVRPWSINDRSDDSHA